MFHASNEYSEVSEEQFKNPLVIQRITNLVTAMEEKFRAGDQSALFSVVRLCAQYQAVIPAWAADAILQGDTDLDAGRRKDFNDLFGWCDKPSQQERRREAMILENTPGVVVKLAAYRCDGGGLNAEEAFGTISEETGLPRRIVEEIYRRYKESIKNLPQGGPKEYGFMFADMPMLRRVGRPLL